MLPPFEMRRFAYFVSKVLIQTFFKKFGGAWGGAPRIGVFFLKLFLLRLLWSKEKAAKWDGLFREKGLLFGGRSPHPPQAVPLPRWGRLYEQTCPFCFKVFDPNFFQKVWRGFGRRPKNRRFFFGAFFLRLRCQRKKRLNGMGAFGRTK